MAKALTGKRTRNIFSPHDDKAYKLSRSKIELFVGCQRCFYLDRRLGISRPPMLPYTLNSTVDKLLKEEFDAYRQQQEPHPLMVEAGVDAVPFQHEDLEIWRANFQGMQYLDPATNFMITGAIDDLWISSSGELIVVDYKSTAKSSKVTVMGEYQAPFRRQAEIYQWILRNLGFRVSSMSYFVYCNAKQTVGALNHKLEFDIDILPYEGKTEWISPTLLEMYSTLSKAKIPDASPTCGYCAYQHACFLYEQPKPTLV